MDQRELERRLNELTERIARIEQAIGESAPSPDSPIGSSPPTPSSKPEELTAHLRTLRAKRLSPEDANQDADSPAGTEPLRPNPDLAPTTAPPTAPPIVRPVKSATVPSPPAPVVPPPVATRAAGEATPASPAKSPPADPPRQARPPSVIEPSQANATWEQQIGGRWAAWVGALAVIVAGGFAVKIGIDRGLWGMLSPLVRCLIVGGFGAGLIAAGEFAHRRFGRAASAGLLSAGLGTLYVDAFASLRFFGLVNEHWALVLMGLVALLGLALTIRTRFLTIGVLSLLGGYGAPILLHSHGISELGGLIYLTALLGIALGLSAASQRFRPLRYLALAGQSILALLWMVESGTAGWMPALISFTAWWMMLVGETVLAALRNQSRYGNVLATLIATALYVSAAAVMLNFGPAGGEQWVGAFCLSIALIGIAVAVMFGPGIDALREPGHTAMDRLAAALWAQAGALLIIAVAFQFDGYGQSIAWLAMGVAAIEAGRRLPSRAVDAFGLITGSLALLRVCFWDSWAIGALRTTLVAVGPITITGWSIIAFATVMALIIAAHRLRSHGPRAWRQLPIGLMVLAGLGWLGLTVLQSEGLMTTALWLLPTVILIAVAQFGSRLRYLDFAWTIVLLAAARWVMFDGLMSRADAAWSPADAWPLVNGQMALGLAIVAALWWAGRRQAGFLHQQASLQAATVGLSSRWQWLILGAFALITFGLTLEANRALHGLTASGTATWSFQHVQQLVWTMLWSFAAVGTGLLARFLVRTLTGASPRTCTIITTMAWVVLSLCGLKWVLVDCLFFAVTNRSGSVLNALPFVNLQLLCGIVLIGGACLLKRRSTAIDMHQSGDEQQVLSITGLVTNLPVVLSGLILWGLSFEVDRVLAQLGSSFGYLTDPVQARLVWWTALWAIGGAVMMVLGRARDQRSLMISGWVFAIAATVVWLMFPTLGWRLANGAVSAPLLLNELAGTGTVLLISLIVSIRLFRRDTYETDELLRHFAPISITLAAVVLLWIGSFEIDRFFSSLDQPMGLQAALSVYWGIFGVVLVIAGFRFATGGARYAGLALLAVTMVKVLFVDLSQLDNIWRVVSFLVSGLLLIGVSILYARLSPRGQESKSTPAQA